MSPSMHEANHCPYISLCYTAKHLLACVWHGDISATAWQLDKYKLHLAMPHVKLQQQRKNCKYCKQCCTTWQRCDTDQYI